VCYPSVMASKLSLKVAFDHSALYLLSKLAILAVALALRLWLWADQGATGTVYAGDQDEYYRGAIHLLLHGDYYDDGQWLRPPVTSLFLASIFALVGVNLPLAMLFQVLVSLTTLLILFEFTKRLFNSERASLAALLLAALFLPYASYASQMLSETLFIFFTALALLLFEIARQKGMPRRWLFGGGVVWGIAVLTRPVGLYALPFLLLWAILPFQRSFLPLKRSLALCLGFLLIITPWTIRNYAVYQRFVLIDTNGGLSFWLGNLREPEERNLQLVWNKTIPNSADRQKLALQRAWANITQHPKLFLARLRYKTVSLWQLETRLFVSNAPIGITLDESSLAFALISDIEYLFLMLLAISGVFLAKPKQLSLTLLGWPLYGTLISAVSLGHPRLRLPLLIPFFIYAALPLAHPRFFWQQLKTFAFQHRIALGFSYLCFFLLIAAKAYLPFLQSEFWLSLAHLTNNEAMIQRAIKVNPANYLPYRALGDFRRAKNDFEGALAAYNQAAEQAPQNCFLNLQRIDLYRQMGKQIDAQKALEDIIAVGWENNQLYEWAWHNLPADTGPRLDIAAPATGFLRGFSSLQIQDEHTFRWTTQEKAQIHFNLPEADTLIVELRSELPNIAVELVYQNKPLQILHPNKGWQRFVVPLPAQEFVGKEQGIALKPQIIELNAPLHILNPKDPYPRGIALAAAWLERRGELRYIED